MEVPPLLFIVIGSGLWLLSLVATQIIQLAKIRGANEKGVRIVQ